MTDERAPSKAKKKRRRATNPYWGFGWVGWVGVVVLAGAIVLRLFTIDPLYWLQYMVAYYSGPESVWHVTSYYIWFRLFYFDVPFGMMGALVLAAALAWAAPPTTRFYPAIALCGLLGLITLVGQIVIMENRALRPVGIVELAFFTIYLEIFVLEWIALVVTVLVIARATRSEWVGWSLLGSAAVGMTVLASNQLWPPWFLGWFIGDLSVAVLAYYLALTMPVLLWGTLRRRQVRSNRLCSICDYDITGLDSPTTCPECGAEIGEGLRPAT